MREKYLAKSTAQFPWPGLELGPPDSESSALTMRLSLHCFYTFIECEMSIGTGV